MLDLGAMVLSINLSSSKLQMYCCNLNDVLTKFVDCGCLGTKVCYLYGHPDAKDFNYYLIQATVCFSSDYSLNARGSKSLFRFSYHIDPSVFTHSR